MIKSLLLSSNRLFEFVIEEFVSRFFEKKLRKKLSCRKVFGSFQKKYARSAVATAKLDVCDIKIVTANPDGVI